MELLRLILTFILISSCILATFLQTIHKTPLVCPETCNCSDSGILSGSMTFYLRCETDNKTSLFKYEPFKGKLYPLNQDAVNATLFSQFFGLEQLYIIDLNLTSVESNLLETQTQIGILTFNGNNINEIPSIFFSKLFQLWAVQLENNNLRSFPLTQLPNPNKLKRIFFSGNYIPLTDYIFTPFSSLQWLFLSRNNLSFLPQYLIHSLQELQELDLSENRLNSIPPFFFSRSKFLTNLNLAYNNLITLSETFSWGLFNLRELRLSHNDLTNLSDSSFDCLWKVQNITLDHNKLTDFSKISLYSLTDLLYLYLDHNYAQIDNLPIFPSKLVILGLSHNLIDRFFTGDWSDNLNTLVRLDLSFNNLSYVDFGQFDFILRVDKTSSLIPVPLRNKAEINLNNNSISDINVQMFTDGIKKDLNPTFIYLNNNLLTRNCLCEQKNSSNSNFRLIFDKIDCGNTISCKELAINCPESCSCFSNGVLDCTNALFTEIPNQISFFPLKLTMNAVNLTNLNSLTGSKYHNLENLQLIKCFLLTQMLYTSNNQSVFKDLNQLKQLFLSHNLLSNLPETIFQNLELLHVLDLSYNLLEFFPRNLISNLKFLNVLNIENNKLKTLDLSPYQIFPSVQILNLKSNKIENLNAILNSFSRIIQLDASHNNISTVNECKWPKTLKIISLNDNRIHINNILIFPESLKRLNFASNQIDSFRSKWFSVTNGAVIDLKKNKISRIDDFIRERGIYFQVLLSENSLNCNCDLKDFLEHDVKPKNFVTLEFPGNLNCGENPNSKPKSIILRDLPVCETNCPKFCLCFPNKKLECEKIPFSGFLRTPGPDLIMTPCICPNGNDSFCDCEPRFGGSSSKTNEDEISGNDSEWSSLTLKNIEYESLNILALLLWPNLRILEVHNCIGSVRHFSNFKLGMKPALVQFSLTHNNLTFLPSTLLNNVSTLESVNLSRNGIRNMPINIFDFTDKLEALDLSFNYLNEIGDSLLSNLSELKFLDISNNAIVKISAKMLSNNKNLKQFIAANNNLITVSLSAFIFSGVLEEINFSENFIGKEELTNLNLPSTLKSFSLANNKITQFASHWKYLNSLVSLNLSHNLITEISIDDFIGYSDSLIIDLTWNNITQINYKLSSELRTNPNHKTPTIALNYPIDCDCRINWLIRCLKNEKNGNCPIKIQETNLKCRKPEIMENKLVKELNENELTCGLMNCTTGCNCYTKLPFNIVNCSYANLVKMPTRIPDFTDVLILDGNVNVSLSGLEDKIWKNLRKFYVSFCGSFDQSELEGLLADSKELQVIWMTFDGIRELPTNFFKGLENLREINLSGNEIQSLPSIENLTNLETLNCSWNKLLLVDANLFGQIDVIDLSGNRLEILEIDLFKMAINQINSILNVSHNSLRNFTFLEVFIDTNITKFPIRKLDLSFNLLTEINLNNSFTNYETIINLTHNFIDKLTVPTQNESSGYNFTIDISSNPISCFCEFVEPSPEMNGIDIIMDYSCWKDIRSKFNVLFSGSICVTKENCDFCICIKHISLQQCSMYCSNPSVKALPLIVPDNVTLLSISNTTMSELSGLNNPRWDQLRTLLLSANQIEKIADENLPNLLSDIALDNNRFERPSGWLSNPLAISTSNIRLTLGHNPWICDCDNEKFRQWLLKDGKNVVKDIVNITCENGVSLLNELCDNFWSISGPILITFLLILILSIIVLSFYCKNRSAVLVWIYGKCVCVQTCVTEEDVDCDKTFDAFVSYANEDTDFVTETLVPELEENPPHYKLCIHERDWKVGEQIVDQIDESVLNSRRVILILTKDFINSMWSSLEFKTAHYHSMREKANRIIVIVIGELPDKESLDSDLRMHISLNTYLKWGDKQFWDKLRYAMPGKGKRKRSSIDSVMNSKSNFFFEMEPMSETEIVANNQ